jgi:hypothetical protein
MVNIHRTLQVLSVDNIMSAKANTIESSKLALHFDDDRTCPGAGLYRSLDDVRLVLQVLLTICLLVILLIVLQPQIHDELVYEVRQELLPVVADIVKTCMENSVALRVPLRVKLCTGINWGNLTEFSQQEQYERVDLQVSKKLFD